MSIHSTFKKIYFLHPVYSWFIKEKLTFLVNYNTKSYQSNIIYDEVLGVGDCFYDFVSVDIINAHVYTELKR